MASGFRYRRRVQFAETDLAGIVHFSIYFRYMEEAEHALWRAAGLTIARPGEQVAWPRVSAGFEYKSPLRFEEEFDVAVGIAALTRVTIQYGFTIARAETTIGTGTVTVACVDTRGGTMKAVALPAEVVEKLRAAAPLMNP